MTAVTDTVAGGAIFPVKEAFIDIITLKSDMQARANSLRCQGKTIALAPTMGFLHAGHLSLMRLARGMADILVVSIFVNPTQFGPGEDLAAYPRDFERDRDMCSGEGVDILFYPDAENIYGPGFQTFVTLEKLPVYLCGASRPVHFRGVATIVTKLFNIVKPHVAVFGQKDYQQLTIIRQMVQDMDMDIRIVGAPIVREADGLAMSSRNAYLNASQRPAALSLSRSLQEAQTLLTGGQTSTAALVASASRLIQSFPETEIDYVTICDSNTLENIATVTLPALMALAVKVGKTRLIDNTLLMPPSAAS